MSRKIELSEGRLLDRDGALVPTSALGATGVAAIPASRTTFTQTYSTADTTVATATAVAVATTSATNTTPFGYAQAQADAIVTNVNALVADVLILRKLLNSVIDSLQAAGVAL